MRNDLLNPQLAAELGKHLVRIATIHRLGNKPHWIEMHVLIVATLLLRVLTGDARIKDIAVSRDPRHFYRQRHAFDPGYNNPSSYDYATLQARTTETTTIIIHERA